MNPELTAWSALTQNPQNRHFNFTLFFPAATNKGKNFRVPFLIDLPKKKFSPTTNPKTPLGTKGFLFCNNTKVISQVLFL